MRRPTDSSVITLPFGATSPPYSSTNKHQGTDYRAPTGSNIYAPHSGKVTYSGSAGDCGLAIDIDGGRFKSRLCHNSRLFKLVGNQVNEGDVVALAGATGAAVGSHCHWVLWDNGTRVDGSKYVNISTGEDMATNQQIDEWISTQHYIAFGKPASEAIFTDWRKVLKNNFVEGSVGILKGIDGNAGALKNQPQGDFVKVNEELYRRK